MELSFKDIKFLTEALQHLLESYNQRIIAKQDIPESEDEIADLGNDYMFLEALLSDLEKSYSDNNSPQPTKSLAELVEQVLKLSINDRLLLVESI